MKPSVFVFPVYTGDIINDMTPYLFIKMNCNNNGIPILIRDFCHNDKTGLRVTFRLKNHDGIVKLYRNLF